MSYTRLLPCHLVFVAALGGCNGSVYPVGAVDNAAGGKSALGGSLATGGSSSALAGGSAATGGSSMGAGGVNQSTGGVTASFAGASSGASGGSAAATGGALNTGGNATSTGGHAPSSGGSPSSGGTSTASGGAASGGNSPSTGGAANTGTTAASTGGNSPSTGGTANTGTTAVSTGGDSPSTGGAVSTGGGTAAGGVHSLVAVVDNASNQFAAYDSEGQLAHDYQSLLAGFPVGHSEFMVSIDSTTWGWGGSPASYGAVYVAPPGKYPPLQASEIFLTGQLNSSTYVRIAKSDGTLVDEWPMSGGWKSIRSSPLRKYVLGLSSSGSSGMLLRRSGHTLVWQGATFEAAFSPDDEHLIVVGNNGVTGFTLVETSSGQVTIVNVNNLPTGFGLAAATVFGATNAGAIVAIRRSDNTGQALFWVKWDGSIVPFDAAVPKFVEEYVSRSNGDDTRLLWWRNAYSSSTPVDASLLGWFELDLSSMTNRAVPAFSTTSGDCYSATTYYKLSGSSLLSCACDTGVCTTLATPPAPADPAWHPTVSVSPLRGVVGYGYDWPLDRMPSSTATARLFNPQGSLLATFDGDWFKYDRLDQLVIATASSVVSLSTGKQTPINNAHGNLTVVYE